MPFSAFVETQLVNCTVNFLLGFGWEDDTQWENLCCLQYVWTKQEPALAFLVGARRKEILNVQPGSERIRGCWCRGKMLVLIRKISTESKVSFCLFCGQDAHVWSFLTLATTGKQHFGKMWDFHLVVGRARKALAEHPPSPSLFISLIHL